MTGRGTRNAFVPTMALVWKLLGALICMSTGTRTAVQGFVVAPYTATRSSPQTHHAIRGEASAMEAFFTQRSDYLDVFRNMVGEELASNTESLLDSFDAADTAENSPILSLNAIPTLDTDKQIVSDFLDSIHQSLLDIPVTVGESENEETQEDLDFLEEGRRLLTIGRFHVVNDASNDMDQLFRYCWSELDYLHRSGTAHSGTLLVLPHHTNRQELEHFTETNLRRPLSWLGNRDFEIHHLERSVSAIRFIYKLQPLPDDVEGGLVE